MKHLKKIREKKEMSREELASKSNVSYAMIYSIESGRRVPTVTLAEKISDGLEVSIDELVRGKPYYE